MRKGVTRTIVYMVLGVVLIFVLSSILLQGQQAAGWTQQFACQLLQIEDCPSGGIKSGLELQVRAAIRCGFYRCVEGCDKVKEMSAEFNILEGGCPCESLELGDRVCNQFGATYPIKAEVKGGGIITKNIIGVGMIKRATECDYTDALELGYRNAIVVENNDVKDCKKSYTVYIECTLTKDEYYIWGKTYGFNELAIVCSQPKEGIFLDKAPALYIHIDPLQNDDKVS